MNRTAGCIAIVSKREKLKLMDNANICALTGIRTQSYDCGMSWHFHTICQVCCFNRKLDCAILLIPEVRQKLTCMHLCVQFTKSRQAQRDRESGRCALGNSSSVCSQSRAGIAMHFCIYMPWNWNCTIFLGMCRMALATLVSAFRSAFPAKRLLHKRSLTPSLLVV